MIDQDLQKQLESIDRGVKDIAKRVRQPLWRSLINGILTGMGSIIGVAIALVIIGWLLNLVGVIPALQRETQDWKKLIDQAQETKLPTLNNNK